MGYLGSWKIDDALVFPAITHRFDTGALTDADSVPSYRVYEDETSTAILTGSMAKLDDTNTTGFYSEAITLSAANGFEKGKCYTVYITAAVNSVTGGSFHTFQIEAEVDANSVSNIGANVITATSIAADAITAAKVADGTIDAATFATAAITAASIAADAITDAKVASDVTIASVTGAVGSVTGAVGSVTGNVGGNVTGSVGSIASGGIASASFAAGAIDAAAIADGAIDAATFAANAITAASIAADAITDAKVAADVTIASVTGAVGSVTGAVGSVTGNVGGNVTGSVGSVVGAVGSVTGNVGGNLVGTIGGLTAVALKDFFDTDSTTTYASAVSGSVVKEIADNASGGSLTAADIADAVWDEDATAHQTQGTFGQAIGDPVADTNTIFKAVVTDATGATVGVDVAAVLDDTGTSGVVVASINANAITASSIANGAIDAATFAAGAIDAAALAADAGTEIGTAVWATTTRLLTAGTNIVLAKGTGVTGFNDLSAVQVNAEADTALADVGLTGTVTGRIDATISSRASQTSVDTVDDFVDSEVNAIKAVTDKLDTALELDGAVYRYTTNALEQGPTGGTAPTAAVIADAVWDEVRADHATSGTFGQGAASVQGNVTGSVGSVTTGGIVSATFAAGSLDAVWSTSVRLLTAGTNIVLAKDTGVTGFNDLSAAQVNTEADTALSDVGVTTTVTGRIDAAISTRASQASVDTIDDFLDLEVAAIKAKTDALPAAPAATGDIPTANQNADALLDRAAGVETGLTPRQALRLLAAVNGGKLSGGATTTNTIRNAVADSKNRVVATVDPSGNRTAIVYDLT